MPPDTWRKNDNRTKCEPAGAMNWLAAKGRNRLPVSRWQFKSETTCCGYEFSFGARRQRNTLAYAFSPYIGPGILHPLINASRVLSQALHSVRIDSA